MPYSQMLKKRGRENWSCDSRHCPSDMDARMTWWDKGSQRAREKREWQKETIGDD